MATYREQTVEIALGPKGAFENGNIGALMRRVTQTMGMLHLAPKLLEHILIVLDILRSPDGAISSNR